MQNASPSHDDMRRRLIIRLTAYGTGALAALVLMSGVLWEATGPLDTILRGYSCGLIFLTIHEDMELSWGHKAWKGYTLAAALFASAVVIYFLAPAGWQSAVLILPVFLYLLFAFYSTYKNFTESAYYDLYPILLSRKSRS